MDGYNLQVLRSSPFKRWTRNINQYMEKVKEKVDSIVEELLRIEKNQTTEESQINSYSANVGTSKRAPGRTNTMEGVEERLMMIKEQLCGEPSKLQAVSIVGMGGIGKTTLARNILDDQLIVERFDYRAWVTVSQNYYLKKILLDIVDSMNVPNCQSSESGELGDKLYKHLKGRRYLIILDDIWETKFWDDIKRVLPNDFNGSRIIITTRISNVAFYCGSSDFSHHLQTLNEEQSWNLFRKKLFCPIELVDIGRTIVKNCGGLPLAIVVVAGLLSKINKKRSDWEEIARNASSIAAENEESFLKILSLSYNNLPHHLKPLFLHIGSFPEDYQISISKLIKLWMAEGLLKPIEAKSLEEVAEEYLEDLVKRNLVLITKETSTEKVKRWGIHDVLRDLCLEIACHENFLHFIDIWHYSWPTIACNVRRIYSPAHCIGFRSFRLFPKEEERSPAHCIGFCPFRLFQQKEECGSHVRSLIHLRFHLDFLPSILGFRLLRVLDGTKGQLSIFPTEILELFLLRYLALTIDALRIPPSIFKLQNLQTLIIVASDFAGRRSPLPFQIWEMPNLRHIMVPKLELASLSEERTVGEPNIPENLQTLSGVLNVSFTNEVIEMIPNLKKLKVMYSTNESTWREFHLNNLFHLHQLKTLNIHFVSMMDALQPFPESFAFPLTLNKLSLKGCRIPLKDMTVVGFLPNLQVLKLRYGSFVGEKWESIEGGFPQLRFLLMDGLEIEYWQAEATHFPRLRRLKICYCKNLQEIPCEIGEISTLELVEVIYSSLAAKSAMEMQEEQREMGNDALQVRVHPQERNFSEEKASEGKDEIVEEAPESEEEIQERTLVNRFNRWKHKLLIWKRRLQNAWRSSESQLS